MMKQVRQDGLTYLINEKEGKAKIIGYYERQNKFIIPRLIKHETQEYIVVGILTDAFKNSLNIKTIQFPSDSEFQTIEENAFNHSSIESIFIPASVIDLKEGWCINMEKLTNIEVDPKNSRYFNYEGKMIISKTSEASENYDKIEIAIRNIIEITIPSFIKTIGSCAFEHCHKLQRIDIPSNSELQTIEEYAFNYSSIKNIFIPPHVTKVCKGVFDNCKQLQRIDIPPNSDLQTIEEIAFRNSSISSIFIPPHVKTIGSHAFFLRTTPKN